MPFELRPYPAQTLSPKSDYVQQSWHSSLKPLSERFGVQMMIPENVDPMPHTHLAHEGFQFAKEHHKGNEYVDHVFRAFWQSGKDIGNIEVLTEIAGKIGLNKEAFANSLQERKYKVVHQQALRHANLEAGITAVPTFIIGNQVLRGLNTKERLEQVILEEGQEDFQEGLSCDIDGC